MVDIYNIYQEITSTFKDAAETRQGGATRPDNWPHEADERNFVPHQP